MPGTAKRLEVQETLDYVVRRFTELLQEAMDKSYGPGLVHCDRKRR